ncbi:MAG: hypothetical protein WA439_16035 [Pseudolabrys sp.]
MIAIILSACLVGDPGVCRDHRVSLAPEISVIQCMKNASAFLAQWSDENPSWRVVRWQCRPVSEHDI